MAFSLIPKDDRYFADFDRLMNLVHRMGRLLLEGVELPVLPLDLSPRIKALEVEADDVVRVCLDRLESSFVTPIEREDIHLLTVTIDDVADTLEAAASRLDVFEIREPTEELRAMARALDEMFEQLVVAVRALRSLKMADVRDAVEKVDALEETVDDLYRATLRQLFKRRPEAYDLVRWKEVYDILENAADHGRHVARTINHIVVRHS